MAAIPQERNAVFLANIPEGVPVESDYEVRTLPLPAAADDELVLETLYLSVDPYLRILMRGGQKVGYATPFQKDGEIESAGVSRVIKAAGDYQVGDVIISSAKWADYNIIKANAKIGKLPAGVNPQTFLSAAGLTGLTAYFGLLKVGALETYPKGSTVYVSGAAGATGNAVGQIAKLKGYRVVGSAGSDEKVNWLINDLGFDAAFNYKTSANYVDSLRDTCPNGIDVYFDNVGGEMLDAVIEVINKRGVIINCGAISLYNSSSAAIGPRVEVALIMKELRMQGFLYFSYEDQAGDAIKEIIQWVTEGKFKDVINLFGEHGVPAIPRAFINMLTGANVGKMLVKIKDE